MLRLVKPASRNACTFTSSTLARSRTTLRVKSRSASVMASSTSIALAMPVWAGTQSWQVFSTFTVYQTTAVSSLSKLEFRNSS